MGILRTNTISGIGTDGPVFNGVTKFDTQGYIVPPSGTTEQRSAGITTAQGTIRFNTDSQKLEFYAQDQWWEMVTDTPNLGTSSDTGAGARGVWAGGYAPPGNTNTIQYLNISSTGNTLDFGDISTAAAGGGGSGGGSSTRGIFFSGSGIINIDYITFASTGNAVNFGNSLAPHIYSAAFSNSTRGIHGGGTSPTPDATNIIEYITMASTGDAVDFGDLVSAQLRINGVASPTRGIFMGGRPALPGTEINVIQFISIATLGNTQDFGDLSRTSSTAGAASNATRGLYFGGRGPNSSQIDYITIATTGNSVDFGDLSEISIDGSAVSSPTRAVHVLGRNASSDLNTIEYVNIATQGNAVDFGDALTNQMRHSWPTSNAHGGL